MPNQAEAVLGPCCEILERFPSRVLPADDIEVIARVTDRDGGVNRVVLRWEGPGGVSGEIDMGEGKRERCEESVDRDTERGAVYEGMIPSPLGGSGVVTVVVTARDIDGNEQSTAPLEIHIQDPDWEDPILENPTHRLRINEVSTRNGDWVELHHPGGAGDPPIFLGDIILTDSVLKLEGRKLPNVAIPSGGFLLVVLDGTTDLDERSQPHLPFRLSSCRERVILLHEEIGEDASSTVNVIDSVEFSQETGSVTLGRHPDGADLPPAGRGLIGLMVASPAAPNTFVQCHFARRPAGDLVLSEVVADNTAEVDAGGEPGDWVEVYNRGATAVWLDDWALGDTNNIWPFPAGICVQPRRFLVVWCDSDVCENDPASFTGCGPAADRELHADFEVNREGETVRLIHAGKEGGPGARPGV
jgi:hypothetical protein